jgi:hypothetical protein
MGSRQTFEEVNMRNYELPNEDFLAVLRALHLPSLDLSLPAIKNVRKGAHGSFPAPTGPEGPLRI